MTQENIKSKLSIHCSRLFCDVSRTGQLLSIDASMGIFVHCNGNSRRCCCRILLLWFIQHVGKSRMSSNIWNAMKLITVYLQNMDSFVALLQLQRTSSIYQSMVINASILPLPAVIMLAVSSRGFIFWCLNLLCIPVVLSQAKIIVFGKNRKPEAQTHHPDAVQDRNQATNNNVLEVSSKLPLQMIAWLPFIKCVSLF